MERPAVEFSSTNQRLGISFFDHQNTARDAHNCDIIQTMAAAGKLQATDTQFALTAMGGVGSCRVTFGIAAKYKPLMETRKYAVTCSLSKYFTCRYSSAGVSNCDALKSSNCDRVCRAASWAGCGCHGRHGECPGTSECADNCEMDGRSAPFWCAAKLAGL